MFINSKTPPRLDCDSIAYENFHKRDKVYPTFSKNLENDQSVAPSSMHHQYLACDFKQKRKYSSSSVERFIDSDSDGCSVLPLCERRENNSTFRAISRGDDEKIIRNYKPVDVRLIAKPLPTAFLVSPYNSGLRSNENLQNYSI